MEQHEKLLAEAEELAEGMKQAEKIDWAFRYSYVANAELRHVWDEIKHLKALFVGLGIPILIAVILGCIAQVTR